MNPNWIEINAVQCQKIRSKFENKEYLVTTIISVKAGDISKQEIEYRSPEDMIRVKIEAADKRKKYYYNPIPSKTGDVPHGKGNEKESSEEKDNEEDRI